MYMFKRGYRIDLMRNKDLNKVVITLLDHDRVIYTDTLKQALEEIKKLPIQYWD